MYIIEENKFYRLKKEYANHDAPRYIRIIKRVYDENTGKQTIYYQEISDEKIAHDEQFPEKYESVPYNI